MKKICILCVSVIMVASMEAKVKKDPVIMTVAGKDVKLSEFIFMAKNNNVDFRNSKAIAEYVELFKNFKLKVADAEALTIHQAPGFEKEMERQLQELQLGFLADKAGEDSAMYVIYNRYKVIPGYRVIYFRYPPNGNPNGYIFTKDTVALYEQAKAAYDRIQNGESFEAVGESVKQDGLIYHVSNDYLYPFGTLKVLEETIFSMEPGDISRPVRSDAGFHLFKLEHKIPNPGQVRIAHILSQFPSMTPTDEERAEARKKSDEIYQKAIAGEDFSTLALEFSDDTISGRFGGLLRWFGLGENIKEIVDASFAMENIGDISKPVQTDYGFHVLKLIDRKPEVSFEEKASSIHENMEEQSADHRLDLYRGFDEKMKARHNYVFHSEAWEELKRLADENFPTEAAFFDTGIEMEKTLISIDSFDIRQKIFVYYMYNTQLSRKSYSVDFLQDEFDDFVHEILTDIEKESLEKDYPEFNMLRQEFYDGTLFFEISNRRIWSRPTEEQEQLEKEWIKELNEKYPVTINKKVVKQIKKYIK